MFRSPSTIGLDIGSSSLKIIEVSRKGRNLLISSCGIFELPDDSEQTLISVINLAFNKLGIKTREVNVSISGQFAIVRYIDFPKMNPSQLDDAIKYEAAKYIPYDMNEVILDYSILPDDDSSKQKFNIILVAVKKEVIYERISMLEKADISAKVIDVTSFGIINTFMNSTSEDKGVKAIVNIGNLFSDINVLVNNSPAFTRTIQIGNRHLVEASGVKPQEGGEQAGHILDALESDAALASGIDPVMSKMSREIKLSFDFFENHSGKQIDGMYLSGGLANNGKFCNIITESVGVPRKEWNPVNNMISGKGVDEGCLDRYRMQLPVAIGLALRT